MTPIIRSILLAEDSPADAEMAIDALREAHLANPIVHVEDGIDAMDYLLMRGKHANRADGMPAQYPADLTWEKYKEFGTLMGKPVPFALYRAMVSRYTPEVAAEMSGLSVEQLKMLGALFSNPKLKIVSLWCMGMNQHTMGTAINNLVHGIHLLSGHFGKPGDGPQSLTGQPSACGTVREVGPVATVIDGCVGCGLCGENAHAAVLCPSFYRAEVIRNPGWWDKYGTAIY